MALCFLLFPGSLRVLEAAAFVGAAVNLTKFKMSLIILLRNAGWNDNAPWIGGRKFNGEWRWYGLLTGPISLSYWRAPQPDGDGNCLQLTDRGWNDLSCTNKMYYFCERIPQL